MKTAMQELIEDLKGCKSENPFIQNTTDLIIELAIEYIEKEKQQIIDAVINTSSLGENLANEFANDYFNETF